MAGVKGLAGAEVIEGPATVIGAGGGTVTDVTATAPIASSGGAAPNISFPTWPADAVGFLANDGAGVLSWATSGHFVRLLPDPTIDQDVGGFHVTLSGLSDTAFLVGTLTNASGSLFRGLNATAALTEMEYTLAAANSLSGVHLTGPANDVYWNFFGSGTAGAALGWGGGSFNLPAGAVLQGGIVDSYWFRLSGSLDWTASFQLYDNGLNFGTSLAMTGFSGGPTLGAVSIACNPRVNGIPPDFSIFHGSVSPLVVGDERFRITNDDSEGPGTAKLVFGNVAAFATMSGNTSRDFQFVGNTIATNLLLNSNGPGSAQLSLYSLDSLSQGDGIHLIAYAQDGVEPSEYVGFNVGAFERWQIPYTGTAPQADNTEFILEANYAAGLDGQTALYSARVGNTATTDSRVSFGAQSMTGADADFVLYTGGTESLRISGATKKVTMPGILDPPAIVVENKTQSDTAVAPITFTATDTNSNASSVSWGIELDGSGVNPGDLVARTGAAVEALRIKGTDQSVIFASPIPTASGGTGAALNAAGAGEIPFFGAGVFGTDSGLSFTPIEIGIGALNVWQVTNPAGPLTIGSASGPELHLVSGTSTVYLFDSGVLRITPAGDSDSELNFDVGLFNPGVTNKVDLGTSLLRFKDAYLEGNLQANGTGNFAGELEALSGMFYNYVKTPQLNDLVGTGPYLALSTSEIVATSVGTLQTPFSINTVTGSSVNKQEWRSDGTVQLAIGPTCWIEGVEQAEPAAPADTKYRIFAMDAGGGKTKLMCRFNTGASQQIALEP